MENRSHATWKGKLKGGKGEFAVGKNEYLGVYSFASRFEKKEDTKGTNPEELLAAAYASCFSMALSGMIEKENGTPEEIHTVAKVSIEKEGEGFAIKKIHLKTTIKASDLDDDKLKELAEKAKGGCPVSKLFKGNAEMTVEAKIQ